MPPLASNRFSVLGEEASDLEDLRIEMEDLRSSDKKTEQSQLLREVSGVSVSNFVTCLTSNGIGIWFVDQWKGTSRGNPGIIEGVGDERRCSDRRRPQSFIDVGITC